MPSLTKETAPGAERRLGRSRPRYGEAVAKALLFAAALMSVGTTLGIVFVFIEPTFKFFEKVSPADFFFSMDWGPLIKPETYGVLSPLLATLITTVVALVVAMPLGLGAAIYLSEYAPQRVRKTFKPVLEVLAGIPTVVYGFFALLFVTPLLRDNLGLGLDFKNGLSAGLVMGFMIIPTIASLSEDAMSAVPDGLREGAYALGSSRMIVSLRVVLPAALSGIVAATILAFSRAFGETMIVAIAAGVSPLKGFSIFAEMQTLSAFIAQAGSGDVPVGSQGYNTIFAVGAFLFLVTLLLNMLSTWLVRRFREVYE